MEVVILKTVQDRYWAVVLNRNRQFFTQGPIRETIEEAREDGRVLAKSTIVEEFKAD